MAAASKPKKNKMAKSGASRGLLGSVLVSIATFLIVVVAIVLQVPQPDMDWDNRFLPLAQKYMGSSSSTSAVFEGLTVLITGATSGIGMALTKSLTSKGATVIATGRSTSKLQQLQESIALSPGKVVPIVMELSDLSAVAKAADQIKETVPVIDVIVNNAGMHYMKNSNPLSTSFWAPAPQTPQGHDVSFTVNYLSHVLLVEKLLPTLQNSTKHPTVLQMSSSYHWGSDGRDLESINGAMPLAAQPGLPASRMLKNTRAYANSKLAQILHASALQLTVTGTGTHVRFASICPGWVGTSIVGGEGSLLHMIVNLLAYPADKWGLASTYAAMLDLEYRGDSHYHDFYINSNFSGLPTVMFTNVVAFPNWAMDTGLRSMFVDGFAGCLLFLQKLWPTARPTKSSVESYNRTLALNLHEWSKQELQEYL